MIQVMILSEHETAKLLKYLWEIDKEASGKGRKAVINTRTRNIRLMLSRARRREKGKLL